MDEAEALNIEDLYLRYLNESDQFVDPEIVFSEAGDFLKRKIPKNSFGSKKWQTKAEALTFWRHYKLRKSYALGSFKCDKKGYNFSVSLCNYLKSKRGNVYYACGHNQEKLYMFTGHFFDRLTQRHSAVEYNQVERERAIREGIGYFCRGRELAGRDPLLLDPDGTCYHIMDGGYAVGGYLVYEQDPGAHPFPRNQSGKITVCFFKTFLSDLEISEDRMEHLLHLYRINGAVESVFT